jgi:carbamoyl-phosphate synthase small subunit
LKALLALEDGTHYFGRSIGAAGESFGEVVFNTSMTGYQEILTDPSYKGQIVTMTYPLIGNYGVNMADLESAQPPVEGFVVRELSRMASSHRAQGGLTEFLKKHKVVGIEGIDTRALTIHIRALGAMKGAISTLDLDPKSLAKRAKAAAGIVGRDLVKEVTCQASYRFEEEGIAVGRFNILVYDFGVKRHILRKLVASGGNVTVVPASTPAEDTLKLPCDGILLSNGPGDPAAVEYAIETVSELLDKKPLFGICLGHQILGLALGMKTFKLKFGHRGANQPVKDLATGKVEITAQNHGFAVVREELAGWDDLVLTHINLNDQTVEGLQHKRLPIFSVQYHPEASPGPHDADYMFRRFLQAIEKGQ